MDENSIKSELKRIGDALDRLSPLNVQTPDLTAHKAFLWHGDSKIFTAVEKINAIDMSFLIGLELQKSKLLENTKSFANGYPANNALLWGARGMGKSSLVKAVHKELMQQSPNLKLTLIEILREDIETLHDCLDELKKQSARFILFCDDLSFDQKDQSYKSLKAILEGGLAGRPDNVLFYATSNQRHLINRNQSEYQTRDAIHGGDITNETISLSDRFGLWLGFHNCSPDEYNEMVKNYAAHYAIPLKEADLIKKAHQWSMERGNRSGRVAWQFIQHLLGVHKIKQS